MNQTKKNIGTAADKADKIWGDLVPVVGFVLVYNILRRANLEPAWIGPDTALYWATGVLIGATLWTVSGYLKRKQKVPLFLVFTAGMVGGFGLLGILLQDKQFLFIKPTIQNLFLASLIFGSLLLGKNIWKVMFASVFDLPDAAWKTLALRWGLFFVAMALWNEYLWRNFSEDTWANWKLGNMVITFVFAAANVPYTLKHLRAQDTDEPPSA
jgi:intracellular septation protein